MCDLFQVIYEEMKLKYRILKRLWYPLLYTDWQFLKFWQRNRIDFADFISIPIEECPNCGIKQLKIDKCDEDYFCDCGYRLLIGTTDE